MEGDNFRRQNTGVRRQGAGGGPQDTIHHKGHEGTRRTGRGLRPAASFQRSAVSKQEKRFFTAEGDEDR